MHLLATTTDTIDITLPDGSVVSATGEAWVKWLMCGKEWLATCQLRLAHIELDVETLKHRVGDGEPHNRQLRQNGHEMKSH